MDNKTSPQLLLILNGPILKMLFRLAIPNVAAIITLTAIMLADASFVGKLGTTELASLALVFPFQSLMQMMGAGAIGGVIASSVARARGSNDSHRAEEAAWHGLIIIIVMSLFYAILLGIFCRQVFQIFDATEEVLKGAVLYSQILFGAALVGWLYFFLFSLLRAIGEIPRLSRIVILSSLVQIALSGALTLGWGPLPSLGVVGPAVAMVLCHGVTSLYMLFLILRGTVALRLRPYSFNYHSLYDIMKVGGIGLLNSSAIALTVVIVTAVVGGYGTEALAGYGLGSRLEIMMIPIAFGIGGVLTTAIGANFGAEQYSRARNIAWLGYLGTLIVTGLVGIIVSVNPDLWMGRFTSNPGAYEFGALYLGIVAPFYGLFGGCQTLYFASQGTGHMLIPVGLSLMRLLVVATVGILATQFSWELSRVFVGVAAGLGIIGLGMVVNMFTPKWNPRLNTKIS